MKVIYIDDDFKCHIIGDETMTQIESKFFEDKCDEFIEGYRYIPLNMAWTREDGKVFEGEMIAPFKNFEELDIAQRIYEKQQLEEYKAIVAEQDLMILDLQYNILMEGL